MEEKLLEMIVKREKEHEEFLGQFQDDFAGNLNAMEELYICSELKYIIEEVGIPEISLKVLLALKDPLNYCIDVIRKSHEEGLKDAFEDIFKTKNSECIMAKEGVYRNESIGVGMADIRKHLKEKMLAEHTEYINVLAGEFIREEYNHSRVIGMVHNHIVATQILRAYNNIKKHLSDEYITELYMTPRNLNKIGDVFHENLDSLLSFIEYQRKLFLCYTDKN